jgi:peptidoglycan DL-endopeptidase CwlO
LNRKAVSAIAALVLAVTLNGNASAAPTSKSVSLKQVKDQRQELETKVENLDNQIVAVMKQIDNNKNNIEKTGEDIKLTQVDLEKLEKNIICHQDLFNKRIRAMYINGIDSYLAVLLQADGLNDFISRVDTVKKIAGFDKEIISDLSDKKDIISKKRQDLDNENYQLLTLKADNEKKLAKLNSDKADQTKLIASLKDKEKLLVVADTAATKLVTSAENKVQQIRDAAPRISRGTSAIASKSASSDSIVAYASNFLGTPYAWGGNGPSTFDCSGFTCYVYAHFGVQLPRIAADQQTVGTEVSRDHLRPGDLVFFGSPARHVGIYVGNECYIHAPRTGDVVKISSLADRYDYSGARRVIK